MARRLIVSGDDLGLHESINRGVIESHLRGIVTSASLVPCGRAFDDACRRIGECPTLDVGLHLTLAEERPLLGPPVLRTLAPEGRLPQNYRQLFVGLLAGQIERREVELELEAQIERALNAGLRISHLDSHQHTHFFPALRPIFLDLAERYGIRGLRAGALVVPSPTKFSLLLGPLARTLRRDAMNRKLATPDSLWLPSPSGRIGATQLLKGIPDLPDGVTELVVHPGADQEALAREYPTWNFDWPGELAAASSGEVRDTLARHDVRLMRYSELD